MIPYGERAGLADVPGGSSDREGAAKDHVEARRDDAHAIPYLVPSSRTSSLSNANTNMRLLQWAAFGLAGVAAAVDINTTHESRNILPSTFAPPKHFRNVNLVRNINLEKSYPRETLNVVVENIDKEAQKEYFIPFEQGTLGRIGGLEVRDKKEPEKQGFSVEIVGIDPTR